VLLATTLFSLHILAIAVLGTQSPGPLLINLIELALSILACIASARAGWRRDGIARSFWLLFSSAWFLWALSQFFFIYYDNFLDAPLGSVWPSDFIAFVFAIPILLTIFLNPSIEPNEFDWQTSLDFIQVGILVILACLLFYRSVQVPSRWQAAGTQMEYMLFRILATRSAALVLCFAARAAFTRSRLVRTLYGRMGLVLFLYGIGDSLFLYGEARWSLRTGTWFELGYTIPLFLAVLVPATWESAADSEPLAVESSHWVVPSPVLPILFPLAVLLVTTQLGVKDLRIARFAATTSFIVALARLGVTQYRQVVSSSKSAEILEELKAQRGFLRLVIDSNPQLVFAKDWDGHFTLANKAMADIYGTTSEGLVGKRDSDFNSTSEEVANFRVADRQVISTGKPLLISEETVTDVRTGQRRWFQTLKVPLISADGKVRQVLGVATDIGARKQAEAEVLDWKNRYEAAVLASGQIIYDWEPTHDRVTLGGSLGQTLGYTVADANSHAWWMTIVHPQDRESYVAELGRCIASKKPFHMEYRVCRRDGTYIAVRDDGYFILDAAGKIARMVGFVGDVTEQRLLEARMRQSQKMEEVGQLAGGVAHDFNNLLGVIIGQTELLLQRISADDPQYKRVDQIREAAMRGATLTRQLLAFGRRQVLQTEMLDLNRVLKSIGELLRRIIGEDVELVCIPDENLGVTKADPAQVEQIILNLAVNARDAMPKGGRLTIETGNIEFDEDYCRHHLGARPGKYVMLRVTDTGCGMDSKTMARIFEPFFTTKEVGKGTGLGLSTVYGIVKQSEGFIWVDSQPNEGSEFTVFLPRAEAQVAPSNGYVVKSPPSGGSETVLLVEDEADFRELASESLQDLGYRVLTAANGRKAMQLAQEAGEPIDLLVTDVVMPGMSGRELVEMVRTHRPAIKVLYMSGYTRGVIAQHGVLESGTSFLQKPFMPSDLARTIREALDAKIPSTPDGG
jgi:two-component system, cell cycle sensor histidine kinase and response regulator CckA